MHGLKNIDRYYPKEIMDGDRNEKVHEVQQKVEEVKLVMADNIDKMLDRGERLSLLDNKTTFLSDSATRFKTQANRMKNSMCLENKKVMIYSGIILIACMILVIWIIQASKRD